MNTIKQMFEIISSEVFDEFTINISSEEERELNNLSLIYPFESTSKVRYDKITVYSKFAYKKIIFNAPATIIIWSDNSKTVVKCGENDIFDPEKGIALCFMKRALGNKSGPFNKVLKNELIKFDKDKNEK